MSELQGQPGELRMTLKVTRASGQEETFEMIGTPAIEEAPQIEQERETPKE